MRITLKLGLAVGLCILGILGINAFVRLQTEAELVRADIRRDHATLGRALSSGIELLLEREDPERALELISAVSARENEVQIRWLRTPEERPVHPGVDLSRVDARHARSFDGRVDGEPGIITYIGVDEPGGSSTIELFEAFASEDERVHATVVRTVLTTLALLAACLVALLGFGHTLVGRPIALLRDHARRVGQGDLSARVASRTKDELGDLAREMDAMAERLESTRALAEREAAARAKALERLRHADRLRAVGEMASAVAHEVGTPLSIVRARAQQLTLGELPRARVEEIGGIVMAEVDRVSAIIRRMLDLSRRDVREITDVVVAEWARETIALLTPLARAEGVELTLDAKRAGGQLSLEAGTLRQVLINLVMNAIQATPRGGRVAVQVSTEDRAIHLSVEDDGAGVPEALRGEIFEPFFTTKETSEGTGLGLSVAAGIVRQQSGTIHVTNREEGGARFEVVVPEIPPATAAEGVTRRRRDD